TLARSLRARAGRWRRKWFDSDGLIHPDGELRAALERRGLQACGYSPTALEKFAACPYQFLLHSIYHLQPRQTPDGIERLDPLTRGSLLHAVLFRLHTGLRRAGLLPIGEGDLDTVRRLAYEALDATVLEYREALAPALDRVWDAEVEDLRA